MAKVMSDKQLVKLIEAAIFSAEHALSIKALKQLVASEQLVSTKQINLALEQLKQDYDQRGVHLVEVASGYRFQVAPAQAAILNTVKQEKPVKYSQALLETLTLIAYKQPITRGEIEDIRGVSVSSHIIKMLTERAWIKIVGQKEVPGRPALYGTTALFLDYFGLKSIKQLPELMPLSESAITESAMQDIITSNATED